MIENSIVVDAKNLVKNFGHLTAVNDIDFQIFRGECFGFLGPNGAGKTTTVKMIHCFSPLSAGRLQVLGYNVREHPREIKMLTGVCPQEVNLDPDFSVWKNLWVFARYFGISREIAIARIERLLKLVELTHKNSAKVENLSGGMKRRLMLARALINEPRLLILDEPTTGLDPQARHLLWDRIRELKSSGVTIVLTTHYMDEAEQLCDRLLFIDNGKIIETGSPRELIKRHTGNEILELYNLESSQIEKLRESEYPFEIFGTRALYYGQDTQKIVNQLMENNVIIDKYTIRSANLEDVFLRLTGHGLRD